MIGRRSFLLRAAPALLIAKPALAASVCTLEEPMAPLQRVRAAWGEFCLAADALATSSHAWRITGAGGRKDTHFIHFALVDLIEREDAIYRYNSERHTPIEL